MRILYSYGITLSLQIITLLASMLAQGLIARALSVADRGKLAILVAYASIGASILILGLDRALQVHINKKLISLANGVKQLLLYVGIIFCLAMIFATFFFDRLNDFSGLSIFLTALFLPLLSLNTGLILLMCGEGLFLKQGMCKLGLQLIVIILFGVSLITNLHIDYSCSLAYQCISFGVINVIAFTILLLSRSYYPNKLSIKPATLRYGLSYAPGRAMNLARTAVLLPLIGWLGTQLDAGVFIIALNLNTALMVLPNCLNLVLQPKINKSKNGCPEIIFCLSIVLGVIATLASLLLAVIFPIVIFLFFGSKYHAAIAPSRILLGYFTFEVIRTPLLTYFIGRNKPTIVTFSTIIQTVLTISILFLFHKLNLLLTAAWAILGGEVVATLLLGWIFLRNNRKIRITTFVKYSYFFCLEWLNLILSKVINILKRQKKEKKKRSIVLVADKRLFIKKVPPEQRPSLINEYQKCKLAQVIAQKYGFFKVPSIHDFNYDSCQYLMTKECGKALYKLPTSKNVQILGARIGKSLAFIHQNLKLADENKISLPRGIEGYPNSQGVFLHGDFSPINILVDDDDIPVILDWSCSDIFGGKATFGPGLYDLAFFVTMCLRPSSWTFDGIALANEVTFSYLRQYSRAKLTQTEKEYIKKIGNLIQAYFHNKVGIRGITMLCNYHFNNRLSSFLRNF